MHKPEALPEIVSQELSQAGRDALHTWLVVTARLCQKCLSRTTIRSSRLLDSDTVERIQYAECKNCGVKNPILIYKEKTE